MDPFTIASLIAPVAGGLLGQSASAGARSNAENDMKEALAAYNIPLPDLDKMRLALEDYQSVGNLTPQMEALQNLGPSALQGIQTDPKYNEYTLAALQKMKEVSDKGLPEADRAQLQSLLGAASLQNKGAQQQILENRQARGMGGSGDELAAQLAASQGGANRASNEALQLASMAAQRKLDATGRTADLAQSLSNTDYGRQANLATAQDAISKFNISNAQDVGSRNVNRGNQAQQTNLANMQNISNQNVGQHNYQQEHNKNLQQQQFNNQMSRAGGIADAHQNLAAVNQNNARATARMYAGIGSSLGEMMQGMGSEKQAPFIVGDQSVSDGDTRVKAGRLFQE